MEHKFKKAVVIFIDILGSQNRVSFDEWYKVMSIFSTMVEREKELDNAHEWTVYKREIHIFSDCAYIIYDYKDGVEDSLCSSSKNVSKRSPKRLAPWST